MPSLDQIVYDLNEELKHYSFGSTIAIPETPFVWFWVEHWFNHYLELQTDRTLIAMYKDNRARAKQLEEEWEHLSPYVDDFLQQYS